jgi:CBS domain-containing protein
LKVKEIMTRNLTAVEEDTPIKDLIYILDRSGLGSLPVVDSFERPIGFISERDIIEAALPGYFEMLHGGAFLPDINRLHQRLKQIENETVGKYMTKEVIKVSEDDDDLYAADLMIRRDLKVIPVVNKEGILVGVVRRIDLLKDLIR